MYEHRCPSGRLALPQGTCELPYQYRGHLSTTKSLVGKFRQVTMIIRDKILRFPQKFEKKFFATSFFRTKIYPSLSKIFFHHQYKTSTSRLAKLAHEAHVTCLGQSESRKLTFRQNWCLTCARSTCDSFLFR